MPVRDELEGGARLEDGHGRSAPAAGSASHRSPRSVPADVRDRRHGEAEAVGQGVQPQPREARPPQRAAERSGEPPTVAKRQRSRRPQAPSGGWGAKPRPPSEARLPLPGLRNAQVVPEGREGIASSDAPQAKRRGGEAGPKRSPREG